MDQKVLSVMIADDHTIVRAGIAALLTHYAGFEVIGEANNGVEAVEMYRSHRPDVVLMDLRMPEMGGVAAITQIKSINSNAAVVILTTFDGDEDIYRGMKAGAKGYVLKDAKPDELIDCIKAVNRGQNYIPSNVAAKLVNRFASLELTDRETEILIHVANGESNKRIASNLEISEGTVKTHIATILGKLDATSRTEAVAIARRRGLIED